MSNEGGEVGRGMVMFGLGVIAGGVVALLLAPASGEETRRRIGGVAAKVAQRARQGVDEARDFVGEQKDQLGAALDAGRQAYKREGARSGMSSGTARPDNL